MKEWPEEGSIKALLLVVERDSPLVKSGPCNSRPPVVWRSPGGWWWSSTCRRVEERDSNGWYPSHPEMRMQSVTLLRKEIERALVLAWGGEPCHEGMDRLARHLSPHARGVDWEDNVHRGAWGMGQLAQQMGFGTVFVVFRENVLLELSEAG